MTIADSFEMELASNALYPNFRNKLINSAKYKQEISKLVNETYAGGVPKGSIIFKDGSIAGNYPEVLEFDKSMGRPLIGDKPKNKRLQVMLDEDEKEHVEILSKKHGMAQSLYVSNLIKEAWEKENATR